MAVSSASAGTLPCGGDCDGDGMVTIGELVMGVRIALGGAPVDQCEAFDCNGNGQVTVNCLITAVNAALAGCGSSVPSPQVEGPVSGGLGRPFIASTIFDLADVGYREAEYIIDGTATAYTNVGSFAADGRWTVQPGATADYRTRLLVYRPIQPQRFNGTVIVEWLNVSGGLDTAVDWNMGHTELIREGYAWVGVSAQYLGVEGGVSVLGIPAIPLKTTDAARYGSLVHPGDSFAYDIFSQAGQAIRDPQGADPLGGLSIEAVIAAGESQSALWLVPYVNAIHPRHRIYDGFLLHGRGNISAPLSQPPQPTIPVPMSALIRTDLDVPVLTFEAETDLTYLGYFTARQPDSARFRLWEVAGTAHADAYALVVGPSDLGNSPDAANLILTLPGLPCAFPVNSGPQHFVLKAAISALNRWVRDGTPPPSAPRLDVVAGPPIAVQRDMYGNARGGIRTPQVDAPIATIAGEPQLGSSICALFGITLPFDQATLRSLYRNHAAYVTAFNQATDAAVGAGFILPADAELMKTAAAESDIGR